MRDIRGDLIERVKEIDREKQALSKRMNDLDAKRESIELLLKEERIQWERREHPTQPDVFDLPVGILKQKPTRERSPLASFLWDFLGDMQAHHIDKLVESAIERKIEDFGQRNPRKVINFALCGMAQKGGIKHISKGVWKREE